MSLVSFPSWGLTLEDLVQRDGLTYQKFTSTPFSGEVEGIWSGSYKKGKREGYWYIYYPTGVLLSKGHYKNGKKFGTWETYHDNGQLFSMGDYENDKEEGYWVNYYPDGSFSSHFSGTYKNGVKVSD
jgi:antitoxin component YwqK of YwqJK toxin-antitoxin module